MQVVVFDLDKTLIKKNISYQFFKYLYSKRKFSLSKLLYPFTKFAFYRLNLLDLNTMHEAIFANFLKNQDINFLNKNVEIFLNEKLDSLLNLTVYKHLKKHLKAKDIVILMSSSPSFLVDKIAKKLQIDNFFATRYKQFDGKITSIQYFLSGNMKAELLEKYLEENKISFDKIIAFSDSIDDLVLLEMCDKVYLVKPSKKLRKKLSHKPCQIM